MKKEGYSRHGLFGSVNTYDNNGHKTSHSDRGLFGGFNPVMDDVVFGHEDTETSEVDELEDELSLAGLDATELEYMDADERREALEDAGLDPDDYDFD